MAAGAESGLFTGKIISADWDSANEHVLFKVENGASYEWALINIKDPAKSVNLTREFATNFSNVKIFDNSASNLLVVRNGNLHKIDVGARQISAVLIENISDFDFYDSEIVFVSDDHVGLSKICENE